MTTLNISDTLCAQLPEPLDFKRFLDDHKVTKKNGKVRYSTTPDNTVKTSFGNSFVNAAFQAYNTHHHLVMRPDDVWLAIATSFAGYVDSHSEEMRSLFVEHADKKKLCVEVLSEDWYGITKMFEDLLPENVRNWIMPNFSTTSDKDRLVGGAVLMGTMKHYFSYEVHIMCGLPTVTLEGTLEDWEDIYRRVEALDKWSIPSKDNPRGQPLIAEWREALLPVIQKFIDAFKGTVDKEFWNQICNHVSGGSGPSYISGWINVFVYFRDGEKAARENGPVKDGTSYPYGFIATDSVPTGCVEVPIKVNDNGRKFSAILYAGSMVVSYENATNKIYPSYDFAVIEEDVV